MQKLVLSVMVGKQDKDGRITYTNEQRTAVVASTKSRNNLVEEINEKGVDIVRNVHSTDIFLDYEIADEHIRAMVEKSFEKESDDVIDAICDHIKNALYMTCVFYKPSTRSK